MNDYSELKDFLAKLIALGCSKCVMEIDDLQAMIAENEALREDLEHARRQPLYSTRRAAERYQHLKANWEDGLLLECLGSSVLPQDWDAEIDKDMSKESP